MFQRWLLSSKTGIRRTLATRTCTAGEKHSTSLVDKQIVLFLLIIYSARKKKCTLRNAFYFLRRFLGTFPSFDSGMESGEESKGTQAACEPTVPHSGCMCSPARPISLSGTQKCFVLRTKRAKQVLVTNSSTQVQSNF